MTEDEYELDRWFEDDVAAVNNKLVIQRLNRYNEGRYTCEATNREGKDQAMFEVKIICKYRRLRLSQTLYRRLRLSQTLLENEKKLSSR